jgi:hypothetical protein
LYEETLDLRDEAGAAKLISFTRAAVVFMILGTLAGLLVVGYQFLSMIGGVDALLAVVERAQVTHLESFEVFLLAVGVSIVIGVLLIGGFVWQLQRAFDEQVLVQVTEDGVRVERTGTRPWYAKLGIPFGYASTPGVEIPFDAITVVEYADPEVSSNRIEFQDWRAPKFFAGRHKDWIRLDRHDAPAVYVGSDRPTELAGIIARNAPGVDAPQPY